MAGGDMKIVITIRKLMYYGVWSDACKYTSYSIYSPSEDLDLDTEVTLTVRQAKQLGLI